jgi:hypothetical protein
MSTNETKESEEQRYKDKKRLICYSCEENGVSFNKGKFCSVL